MRRATKFHLTTDTKTKPYRWMDSSDRFRYNAATFRVSVVEYEPATVDSVLEDFNALSLDDQATLVSKLQQTLMNNVLEKANPQKLIELQPRKRRKAL